MRRLAATCALSLVALVALVVLAAPAGAVPISGGCQGTADSLDAGGATLDSIAAPDTTTGTKSNPFNVAYDGTVRYDGSGPVMTDHKWRIKVFGVPVRRGGDPNPGKKNTSAGTEVVKNYLPFRVAGLFPVSGRIAGTGGTCAGSGWVKLEGNPAGTAPWLIGVVLLAGGAVLLVFATPQGGGVSVPLRPATGGTGG